MTPTQISAALLAVLGGLLLSGCDDDRPYDGPPPGSDEAAQPSSAPPPSAAAGPSSAAQASNPLLAGGGSAGNPLLSSSSGGNPLTRNNPLLQNASSTSRSPLAQSDPLKGPSMPTEHSHWLNTETNKAHVAVLLNGQRLSSYQPSGTVDVTMKLHPGTNTLTVIYTPQNVHSWGSVSLTEGEHEGQAISLAEFQQAPLHDSVTSDDATNVKSVTKTITFFAK